MRGEEVRSWEEGGGYVRLDERVRVAGERGEVRWEWAQASERVGGEGHGGQRGQRRRPALSCSTSETIQPNTASSTTQ